MITVKGPRVLVLQDKLDEKDPVFAKRNRKLEQDKKYAEEIIRKIFKKKVNITVDWSEENIQTNLYLDKKVGKFICEKIQL